MPVKKNIVTLSVEERQQLEKVARSGQRSVREKTRARILLLSDTGVSREAGGRRKDCQVAAQLRVAPLTVSQVRQRACERGALESIERKEQANRKARKLDGRQEAHLVALACSALPDGCARWSLTLLRDRMIEMRIVEQIGLETIRSTLKKTRSSHG